MITDERPPPTPPPDTEAEPPPARPGNAGALWLLVTGAALLVVAAALFVIVRWDELGAEAKLVLLAGSTVAVAVGAHHSRDRLPLTSAVLTHLAVALVPVNVAAIASRLSDDPTTVLLAAAWSTVIGAAALVASSRSLLALVAGSAALPVAVFASAHQIGLDPVAAGIATAVMAVPAWAAAQLTDAGTSQARWYLPTAALLAGAVGGTLVTDLPTEHAGGLGTVLGVVLLVGGLLGVASGALEGRSGRAGTGAAVALLGTWMVATSLGIDHLEAYLIPLAVVLLGQAGVQLAADGGVRRDNLWLGSLLLAAGPVIERVADGGAGHLAVGVIAAVALCAIGAQLRLGPSVLVGTATLVALLGVEVADLEVQVATWAWVGAAGTVLAGAGALLERSGTGPIELGRNVGEWYRRSFR
ncbi:MAG: DUF2157 domain-containing protein [Actinomycetota bacterium]